MAKSSQTYKQVQDALNSFSSYKALDQGAVRNDLMRRVDAFRPQYNELGATEAQAYATPANMLSQYFDTYGTQPGRGPGAASRLGSIMSSIGQQYGTADAMRNSIVGQQGRITDLVRNVTDMYGQQQDSAWKRFTGLSSLYGNQLSSESAAASRGMQRDAMRFNAPPPPTNGATWTQQSPAGAIGRRQDGSFVFPGGYQQPRTAQMSGGYTPTSMLTQNRQSSQPRYSLPNSPLSGLYRR